VAVLAGGNYIEIVRDSPLLMQLYLVFFALPLLGFQVPILVAGIVTLMINSAPSWPRSSRGDPVGGQGPVGSRPQPGDGVFQAMRWVVLPQAFRVMIPPGVGLLIGLIKDSSVISVISYMELTRVGQILTEKTFLSFPGVWDRRRALFPVMLSALSHGLYAERRLGVSG